jgi:hypothetical protein
VGRLCAQHSPQCAVCAVEIPFAHASPPSTPADHTKQARLEQPPPSTVHHLPPSPGASEPVQPPPHQLHSLVTDEQQLQQPPSSGAGPRSKRKRESSSEALKPSPLALNWIASTPMEPGPSGLRGDLEVTVGSTGLKQGAPKGRTTLSSCSRISQRQLFSCFCGLTGETQGYADAKLRLAAEHDSSIPRCSCFRLWVRTPPALSSFRLETQPGNGAQQEERECPAAGLL